MGGGGGGAAYKTGGLAETQDIAMTHSFIPWNSAYLQLDFWSFSAMRRELKQSSFI